jgi:LAS superfamily LD-carboxypeptidase LdcB
MMNAAAAAGRRMGCTSSFRDPADQIRLRRQNCGTSNYDIYQKPSSQCHPPTAIPGSSMHEKGLAVDLNCGGASFAGTSCFSWMVSNARTYGFKNYAPEPWHWSTTGS